MIGPLLTLDQRSLRSAVGMSTFARGVEYAERGAVVQALLREKVQVVIGSVLGGARTPYLVNVHLVRGAEDVHQYIRGECSCPVRHNCKHCVALALVAGGHTVPEPAPFPATGTWEDSWRSLLEPSPTTPIVPHELAVELTLRRNLVDRRSATRASEDETLELWARVVRQGKKGWVAGDLGWGRMSGLRFDKQYSQDQIRVLHELHALYLARTGTGQTASHLRYGDEKFLEVSAIKSTALMALLEEASRIGLRLVHGGTADLGDLPPIDRVELCLDVTAPDGPEGDLEVTPVLRTADGEYGAIVPIAFLGSGTGAVVRTAGQDELPANPTSWPLRLVTLATQAPAAVRRMALGAEHPTVPAGHRERFLEEYFPRLRQLGEIVSSDGSFVPPEICAPTLVLHADFGEEHALALRWEWAYDLGEHERRLPLDSPTDSPYRDRVAEATLRAEFDAALAAYGPVGTDDTLLIGGMDTMQFATQWLPLLRERPGVQLEITGTPADYREAGDSLRIAVSTKSRANDDDWYDLGVSITVDGETVPFLQVFIALAQGKSHLLLPGGAYFSLEKPELMVLRRLIDEARGLSDNPAGPLRISRYQTDLWGDLAALGEVERQATSWRKHVEALRRLEKVGGTPVPAGVHAELRPYQIEGFEWLAFLWEHRLGGILADDMGLGKTLQALALIAHARERKPDDPPFLIVAPTSVLSNWAAEAARFTPGLRVTTVTRSVTKSRKYGTGGLADEIADTDIVVTSYALLRIDADFYQRRRWAGLLLDEAQFVKNRKAAVHRAARLVPAPFKLAITGTPLENSVMELWALLSIAAPGLFPQAEGFKEFYAVPIERNADPEMLATLRRRLRPLLKRRTKEAVAPELPPKQEQVLSVALEPRHRKVYDVTLQRERQKVLKLLEDLESNRFEILRSLTLLRRLALHPGLTDDEHHDVPCAKIEALVEHVDAVAGTGHRTLVFSQFTGLLDLIEDRLHEEDIEFCRLDGTTTRRAEVIERFKSGTAPVFLISLKAGGFGLNLTEADYCFVMDPWWNPAAEMQAVDRAHRIGQTRTVHVYKLIADQTIEERVLALQARKADLFASVLDGDGERFDRSLSAEDIRGLFS